jgi:hypothetical protein
MSSVIARPFGQAKERVDVRLEISPSNRGSKVKFIF